MTKKQIKSVYHWSLMGLIMGLPLLITLFSYIPNAYNDNNVIEYQTEEYKKSNVVLNEVNKIILDDYTITANATLRGSLVDYELSGDYTEFTTETSYIYCSTTTLYVIDSETQRRYSNPTGYVVINVTECNNYDYFNQFSYTLQSVTHEVVNNGAYQVYQFNQWFAGLPINSWYNEIINLIGAVPTSYTPMANTIYLPLYCIYVLVFDLVYDVLAFVPSIIHSFLDRTKGESE